MPAGEGRPPSHCPLLSPESFQWFLENFLMLGGKTSGSFMQLFLNFSSYDY